MAKKNNPFDMYANIETHKAVIKALNDAEITYRALTMAENDKFQKMMVKGVDDDGNPIVNMDTFSDVKYEKVAAMLVEPKVTVAQLKQLKGEASTALSEIVDLLAPEAEDEEGND